MQRVATFIICVFILWPALASAYILPTPFLMRMMAEHRSRSGLRAASLDLVTKHIDSYHNDTLLGTTQPVMSGSQNERLYLKSQARIRREQLEPNRWIYIQNRHRSAAGPPEHLERLSHPITPLWLSLLLPRGQTDQERNDNMLRQLTDQGIDIDIVTLGRLDNKVVYIIGAHQFQIHQPQLWIDKETWLPVLYRTNQHGTLSNRELEETRLTYQHAEFTAKRLPTIIALYSNGHLQQQSEVTAMKLNPPLPSTLFKITTRR